MRKIHTILGFILALNSSCVTSPRRVRIPQAPAQLDAIRSSDLVITPLIDLRNLKNVPLDGTTPPTFSDQQRYFYANSLREAILNKRQDVRPHSSGPAFDWVARIEKLRDLALKANSKTPFPNEDVTLIKSGLTGYRFVVFFTFLEDQVSYDAQKQPRESSQGLVNDHTYQVSRKIGLSMAIWDSLKNETIFTSSVSPIGSSKRSVSVRSGTRPKRGTPVLDDYKTAEDPDKLDRSPTMNLDQELKLHKVRFPDVPAREPLLIAELPKLFDGSVNDMRAPQVAPVTQNNVNSTTVDSLPKENTRTELTLKSTIMGILPLPTIFIGVATLKHRFLRLGGGVEFTPKGTLIDHNLTIYEVWNGCLCLSADIEWELGQKNRIQTGSYFGAGVFSYSESDIMPRIDGTKPKNQGDGYLYRATRVRYLRGDRNGAQFGLGAYQHFYYTLTRPELVANHPAKWGIELTLAVASGGS